MKLLPRKKCQKEEQIVALCWTHCNHLLAQPQNCFPFSGQPGPPGPPGPSGKLPVLLNFHDIRKRWLLITGPSSHGADLYKYCMDL